MKLTKLESNKRVGVENDYYNLPEIGLVVYMRDLLEELGFESGGSVGDGSRHSKFSIGWISKPIVIVGNIIKGYSIYFMGKREYKVRKQGGVISYEYMENNVVLDRDDSISVREFTDKILETIREVWVCNNNNNKG